MAGLLGEVGDFIFGDDTTRDEYGQTQADRRMPYWSGLVKAGLLAAAGGQRMMPEQRAQYLAQAGGALAGIPEEIVKARSDQAKNLLAQQTIATNKNKLANQAKIQAYAGTPEGQQALAGLKPHEQFAAKVALDSGDIDAFSRIMNSVGTHEAKTAALTLQEQRLELARQKLEQQQGAKGLSEKDAQGYLVKAMNDPAFRATPEYAWALDFLNKERKAPDGSSIPGIDPSKYPRSTYDPGGGAGGGGGGTVDPQREARALQPGEEKEIAGGIIVSKDAAGNIEWEVPGVGDREGIRYQQSVNGAPRTMPARTPIPEKELSTLITTHNTLKDLDVLERELKNPNVKLGDVSTYLMPDGLLNRTNPEGIKARAIIGKMASAKVHDLSGAAVSEGEFKRLEPFIPKKTDTPEIIRSKLSGLREELQSIGKAHYDNLPANSRITPDLRGRYGKATKGPKVRTYNPNTGEFEDG